MSVESLAFAARLYGESTPETAIASQARYRFASNSFYSKSAPWLDIGTNYGNGISSHNDALIRMDINHKYLESQSGMRVQADGAHLPFGPNSVGLVTLFEVIEHVNPDEGRQMLKEASRVVSPEGNILVSTPNRGAYGNRMSSPDHIQEYSQQELESMFNDAGLEVVNRYGQGFIKEANIITKIIKYARDSKIVSWLYYNAPVFLRNKLRIGLQKSVKSDEIRTPNHDEVVKNFVYFLKPKK